MRTIRTKVFKFSELNAHSQSKAIELMSYCLVEDRWWEDMYSDAKDVGITITSFDFYNGKITNKLFDPMAVALKVTSNHGEHTATYAIASDYLKNISDDCATDYDQEFISNIMEEYLILLKKELEWLTSRCAIEEFINANQYEFYADGSLFVGTKQ